MHSIRILEIAALACKALLEIFHLEDREKSSVLRPADERSSQKPRFTILLAQRTIAAVKLSGSVYYLILLTEHLVRNAG